MSMTCQIHQWQITPGAIVWFEVLSYMYLCIIFFKLSKVPFKSCLYSVKLFCHSSQITDLLNTLFGGDHEAVYLMLLCLANCGTSEPTLDMNMGMKLGPIEAR